MYTMYATHLEDCPLPKRDHDEKYAQWTVRELLAANLRQLPADISAAYIWMMATSRKATPKPQLVALHPPLNETQLRTKAVNQKMGSMVFKILLALVLCHLWKRGTLSERTS